MYSLQTDALLREAGSHISKMISDDKTGVAKIIFDNAAFRGRFAEGFKKIYPAQWNSDVSIFFLSRALEELNKLKIQAEQKIAELQISI